MLEGSVVLKRVLKSPVKDELAQFFKKQKFPLRCTDRVKRFVYTISFYLYTPSERNTKEVGYNVE